MIVTSTSEAFQTRVRRSVFWIALSLSAFAAALSAVRTNGDWPFFVQMSRAFTDESGLHVYGDHSNIQSGPVSLIVVRLFSIGGLNSVVVSSVLFAALGCITGGALYRARMERDVGEPRDLDFTAVIGCVVLMFWWSFLKACGHLDDAMVLTIAAVAFLLIVRNQRFAAALLIGIALAVKPWAIFLLPLTMDRADWRSRRGTYPLVSVATGALIWAPFIIADRGTLDGFRPTVRLAPDSVLRLFGFDGTDLSSTLRMSQLLIALIITTVAVLRGKFGSALLGGFAVRLATDPATWSYYTPGFILGAVAWDLFDSRSRVPWATLVSSYLLAPPWVVPDMEDRARFRLMACALALTLVCWPGRRRSKGTSDNDLGIHRIQPYARNQNSFSERC